MSRVNHASDVANSARLLAGVLRPSPRHYQEPRTSATPDGVALGTAATTRVGRARYPATTSVPDVNRTTTLVTDEGCAASRMDRR